MAVLTTTGRAEGLWGTTLLFEGLSRGGGVIRGGVKGSKGGWLEKVWWEEESFLEKNYDPMETKRIICMPRSGEVLVEMPIFRDC